MNHTQSFTFKENRSERALQAHLLVPALAHVAARHDLLSRLPTSPNSPIDLEESKAASVMHFVWVLRDMFSSEREQAAKDHT